MSRPPPPARAYQLRTLTVTMRVRQSLLTRRRNDCPEAWVHTESLEQCAWHSHLFRRLRGVLVSQQFSPQLNLSACACKLYECAALKLRNASRRETSQAF
eukprot:527198-Amphidinium_carterae.1